MRCDRMQEESTAREQARAKAERDRRDALKAGTARTTICVARYRPLIV
jgi:hypothetical protein